MARQTVAVVGGGIVGLCCAWHLQEYGVRVVLLERARLGAGASWGNAGHLAPALAVPLPEPAAVVAGLRSILDPRSPVIVPRMPNRELLRFLGGFLAHAPQRRWFAGMRAFLPLNLRALVEYDYLRDHGVGVGMVPAGFVAALQDAREGAGLLHELAMVAQAGYPVDYDMLTASQLHEVEPLAVRARLGIRLNGQRMVDPPRLLEALAAAVRARDGEILEGQPVTAIARRAGRIHVSTVDDTQVVDAVVLATGAWLPRLAATHGVRVPMYPGRGYSFSVAVPSEPRGMLNFPGPRIACVAYRGRLRVTSLMELQTVERPQLPGHARRFLARARRALPTADWDSVADEWVGARPLTADGLPVVGATRTEGVYVAGGHGMWGVTLGPVTGRLLAALVARGQCDPALAALDPCR